MQDVNRVLRNTNNLMRHNNIVNIVDKVLMQSGLKVGLHMSNYSSPLSDYILQGELPRGCIVPRFTKFAGETNESTVEHIARFKMEADDIANDEGLKMKYFLSSLTKNVFTWFTTLAPNSILTWGKFERIFMRNSIWDNPK